MRPESSFMQKMRMKTVCIVIRGYCLISVEGDLELIGPEHIPFMGGAAAFWVKTKATGKSGTGTVHVCGQAPLRNYKESVKIQLI